MLHVLALLACGLLSCGTTAPAPVQGELIFVRGGVVAPSHAAQGRSLPADRVLLTRAWQPGQRLSLGGLTATAPARAECVPLFHRELGDVRRLVAMGGAAPDTALAFSPAGDRLAVGTYLGEVLVLDAWSGAVLARRSLPEALVRAVVWSADGGALYVSEQSPDATVRALDPATLQDRWTVRLADIVGSSTPPAGQDLYGVYSLPAGFGLAVLPDGGLVVAATHGWGLPDGSRRNQAQVLVLSAQGAITARWPQAAAEVTLLHPVLDDDGQRVVVAVGHSSSLPPPDGLPVGGVQVLDLPDLTPSASAHAEPLQPWFTEARVWEALDLSKATDTLVMGLNDGRLQLRTLDGGLRAQVDGGAPVLAGDVPIHAGIGWALLHGDQAIYATSSTRIPWGAAAPDLRPPSAHPDQNTVHGVALDGQPAWSWTGEHELQGLTVSPDGDELVVGAGTRISDQRRDLYGALVFGLDDATASGQERLLTTCSAAGPVFFRHAVSADGRIALAQYPYQDTEGAMHGTYQLSVFR